MDRICPATGTPHTILELDNAFALVGFEGVELVRDTSRTRLFDAPVDAAVRGPDDAVYCTSGGAIFRVPPDGRTPTDLTARFAGTPQGRRRIRCAPDGEIWVEGCANRRRADGGFVGNPLPPTGIDLCPVPDAWDRAGNRWCLYAAPEGAQALVLPANAADRWQPGWLPFGRWGWLVADRVGAVWAGGADGWQRFCTREYDRGWQAVSELPAAPVSAATLSPDDLLMVAFDSGLVAELDVNAAGGTSLNQIADLGQHVHALHTARDGAVWAVTDNGLHRHAPAPGAWQHAWRAKRGRLPGGGNHDVFSVEAGGQLYVAGGWAGCWGIPPQRHVLDELFAYDPVTEYWTVVSRMRHNRRYNGIAALDGDVWIVGGETRTPDWPADGQVLYTVDVYDPRADHWRPAPSLQVARTDPFVVNCAGRIWAIGGAAHNSGPKLDSVESIGPGEEAWRPEPCLPEPTRQGHGCALDGVIYCASIDGFFAFDTVTGRWDPNLPTPGPIGQGPLAAAFEGEVWILGGHGDRRVRIFDPVTRLWRAGPDLPVGLAWAAAQVIGGELILVGGAYAEDRHNATVYEDRTFALHRGQWNA